MLHSSSHQGWVPGRRLSPSLPCKNDQDRRKGGINHQKGRTTKVQEVREVDEWRREEECEKMKGEGGDCEAGEWGDKWGYKRGELVDTRTGVGKASKKTSAPYKVCSVCIYHCVAETDVISAQTDTLHKSAARHKHVTALSMSEQLVAGTRVTAITQQSVVKNEASLGLQIHTAKSSLWGFN